MVLSFTRTRGMFKWVCFLLLAVVVIEVVVVNTILLVTILSVKNEVSDVLNGEGETFTDKLMNSRKFREMVYVGRQGGFAGALQETVGRMYIASYSKTDKRYPRLSFVGLDVSSSGEAMFLYKRIQSRLQFNYEKLIVDIGANDGLLSSNSFNFIQWGWSAVLVEPQIQELRMAKLNNRRNFNPYNEGHQNLTLVEAVLSGTDGPVDFVVSIGVDKMESHILKDYNKELRQDPNPFIIKVKSYTVRTFAKKYNIPKKFGILSLDIEGDGDQVLHQWMESNYRPGYIIYEHLHNSEPVTDTLKYLERKGYRYLNVLGWNYIFEHYPLPGED